MIIIPKVGMLVNTRYGTGNINDLLPTKDPDTFTMVVALHNGNWVNIDFQLGELTPITIH